MTQPFLIRNETPADHRAVEELARAAFWNLYVPGCVEHYVAHVIREHEDFIPQLNFVMEKDGELIGSIMYTKAQLTGPSGEGKNILTFGPVCIRPGCQRQGYGKALLEYSFQKATELGYDVIVIFGNPGNYVGRGFVSCKKKNIALENGRFPAAMLVKELTPGALDGRRWTYQGSHGYEIDLKEAEAFDKSFPPQEKGWQPSQEEFFIHSHAMVEDISAAE